MKKLKILSITLILCVLGMITYTAKAKNWSLEFDDKYFSSPNGNPIFKDNISDIYFTQSGNDGYGLFFMGTGKATNTTLKISTNNNSYEITCKKQINGYLTTNFTDFGMFPLDETTANNINDTGINYITGGLYYDCTGVNNSLRTGVYGYIKWTYGEDGENVQEIRAGLKKSTISRASTSPIELIYSTNFRNDNRSMSGVFLSNLTKDSTVVPRFTRDIGMEGNNVTGTKSNPYYVIENQQYSDNGITIYTKTEKPGYSIQYTLTGLDIDGQSFYTTGKTLTTNIQNPPKLYGFYGYSTRDIPYTGSMKSGNITIIHSGNTLKSFSFIISGGDAIHFEVEKDNCDNNGVCTCTGGTVTATIKPTDIANQYQYNRTGTFITGQYQNTFTNMWSGSIDIQRTDGTLIKSGLEVIITKIDKESPVLTLVTGNISNIPECTDLGSMEIIVQDTGCGNEEITLDILDILKDTVIQKASGTTNFEYNWYPTFNTNTTGSYKYIFTATDNVGNPTSIEYTFTVIDEPITGHNFERGLKNTNSTFTTSGDRKKLSDAHAGECESENITATSGTCSYGGVLTINWDRFTYTGTTGHDVCSIILSDGDGEITVTGEFYDCTNPAYKEICKPHANPEIINGEKFIDYKDLEFQTGTRKYTSGTQVLVKLNAGGVNDLQSYRASCIQQEIYCRKLTQRSSQCDEESDFCSRLNAFLESLNKEGKNAKICATYENARSDRIDYPYNDEFSRNIENSSGCEVVSDIPYGSRDQGPRKIRVQIKDADGLTGNIIGTEIPVNYSTGSPTLTGTYTPTYESSTHIGQYDITEIKKTLQYANNTNFTTTVIANGAQLNNGTVGLNSDYENNMKAYNILRTSGSNGPKLLYFDDLHEWIISVIGKD